MEEKEEGKEVEWVRFSDEHGSPVHQSGGKNGRMEEKEGREGKEE
jgi:hypothetical protein